MDDKTGAGLSRRSFLGRAVASGVGTMDLTTQTNAATPPAGPQLEAYG